MTELGYCGELVRKYDPDRFLISLMLPPERRPALWALFAFNHEIAKTREVVTETTLGLIRLQWWRDALAKIYDGGEALQNEILPDLSRAIKDYNLPCEWFETLIYAREFDLENVPPASMDGLEKYADFTHTPLLKLALKILGQEESEEVIRAVAISYAMTGLLRAAPFHAGGHRCLIPADLMAAQGVTERNLYELKPEAGFTAVTRTVAERAQLLLYEARLQGKFLKVTKVLTALYLKQIRGAGYDVFNPALGQPPAFFHLRFLLGALI